jgi:hypothetical protein
MAFCLTFLTHGMPVLLVCFTMFVFLIMQQSELEEDRRVGGGGIAADWTYKVTVTRCHFAHNTAYASPKGRGGALMALLSGDVAVVNSSFTNNTAVAEVSAQRIIGFCVLWFEIQGFRFGDGAASSPAAEALSYLQWNSRLHQSHAIAAAAAAAARKLVQ